MLKGPFKEIIPIFQKYKKSIGYKYDNINAYIKLDEQLYKNKILNLKNTKKIYEILIEKEINEKVKEKNYKSLKELYDFMKILGYENLYLEKNFFKNTADFKPIIFTKTEIKKMFESIDKYSLEINNQIYSVFFRLIYSCGLRISEGINLRIKDICLKTGVITIYKSKNNITRIIPLSDSMFIIIKKYMQTLTDNNYLFEKNGKKLNSYDIEKTLKKVTNIKEVRVHDLRETFAVHTLNNLFKSNIKTSEVLYPLSIYMGHTSIESTEYYLTYTNEFYKEIIKKSSLKIFPKVDMNGK